MGTLKRRTSIGGYENHLNIQKEKEQKRKRIMLETIESLKNKDKISNKKAN